MVSTQTWGTVRNMGVIRYIGRTRITLSDILWAFTMKSGSCRRSNQHLSSVIPSYPLLITNILDPWDTETYIACSWMMAPDINVGHSHLDCGSAGRKWVASSITFLYDKIKMGKIKSKYCSRWNLNQRLPATDLKLSFYRFLKTGRCKYSTSYIWLLFEIGSVCRVYILDLGLQNLKMGTRVLDTVTCHNINLGLSTRAFEHGY